MRLFGITELKPPAGTQNRDGRFSDSKKILHRDGAIDGAVDQIRNHCNKEWHESDHQQHNEQAQNKWPDFFDKVSDAATSDAAGGKHHGTERRRNAADHDVDDTHKAEMNGVDTKILRNRKKQRCCNHQSGTAFEEHAHNQKNHINEHQEDIFVAGQIGDGSRNNFRQVDITHVIAEGAG